MNQKKCPKGHETVELTRDEYMAAVERAWNKRMVFIPPGQKCPTCKCFYGRHVPADDLYMKEMGWRIQENKGLSEMIAKSKTEGKA